MNKNKNFVNFMVELSLLQVNDDDWLHTPFESVFYVKLDKNVISC